jgi:hypothetical protein
MSFMEETYCHIGKQISASVAACSDPLPVTLAKTICDAGSMDESLSGANLGNL